ncbi:MAG: Crp/Fnr family transcriptional regulator [Alphaproteobacteria bacterium]
MRKPVASELLPDSDASRLAQRLLNAPLFSTLSESEIAPLVAEARIRPFDNGAVVFERGDTGEAFYYILSGRIGIRTTSPDGKEIMLNILESDEMFGEIAVIDEQPRTAGAIAVTQSSLLEITRPSFLAFLNNNPGFCISLLRVLCGHVRRSSEVIEDTIFRGLKDRLARRLLSLSTTYGQHTPQGIRLTLPLSQETLSQMTGASRESVNREIGVWQKDGVLSYEKGYILIHDPEALGRITAKS